MRFNQETRQHIVLSNIPKRPQLMRRVQVGISLALSECSPFSLKNENGYSGTVQICRYTHDSRMPELSVELPPSRSVLHSVSLSWFFLRSTSPLIASVSGTCVYNKPPQSVSSSAIRRHQGAPRPEYRYLFRLIFRPRETASPVVLIVGHSKDYSEAVQVV